jgi:hypothetical protein
MRANSSVSSLVVVVVALLSGCSPGGDPPVAGPPSEPPAPPAPAPVPTQPVLEQPVDDLLRNVENVRAAESQAQLNEIRERTAGDAPGPSAAPAPAPAVPPKTLDRLVYQCTGDVTFAVRVAGDRLEVFPPEHTHGYVVLDRVPSDDGVRYTAPDADFRAKDDLATLRIARQIYVDCISNPAASMWQGLPRRVGPIR